MHISIRAAARVAAIVSSLLAVAPVTVLAQPSAEEIPGVSDGPVLSPYAAKMTDLGFASRRQTGGETSKDGRALTFSEEGAKGKSVNLTIDPISGRVQEPVQSKR